MVAAFAFGFGASLLRLAFGGHYLSDVLLGGLLALIVIEIVRRVIWPRGTSEPDLSGAPGIRRSRRQSASGRPAG
jgi:membrane-associated phospholipid phosphatase